MGKISSLFALVLTLSMLKFAIILFSCSPACHALHLLATLGSVLVGSGSAEWEVCGSVGILCTLGLLGTSLGAFLV